MFIQLVVALHYLHSQRVLHRDLKSLNVFLSRQMTVKLGDLGVAKVLGTQCFAHTLVGTPYYLSPELCEVHNGLQSGAAASSFHVGMLDYTSANMASFGGGIGQALQ